MHLNYRTNVLRVVYCKFIYIPPVVTLMTLIFSSTLRQESSEETCVHRSGYRQEKWKSFEPCLNVSAEEAIDCEGYYKGHFVLAECK